MADNHHRRWERQIVADTNIDSVTTADLKAVADGKNVTFKSASEIVIANGPSGQDATPPLFAVSVSKASPDTKMSQVNHYPTGMDFVTVFG